MRPPQTAEALDSGLEKIYPLGEGDGERPGLAPAPGKGGRGTESPENVLCALSVAWKYKHVPRRGLGAPTAMKRSPRLWAPQGTGPPGPARSSQINPPKNELTNQN